MGSQALGPLLSPSVNDLDVRNRAALHHAFDEPTLTRPALYKLHLGTRQGHGKRKPRKAGAGADIGDSGRLTYYLQLKRHERVGEMHVERMHRLAHGGGGVSSPPTPSRSN